MWFRVVLPYAAFGVRVEDGLVVEAAPIGRWAVGKPLAVVTRWVVSKGGIVRPLNGPAPAPPSTPDEP